MEKWSLDLGNLENITVARCYKASNFGKVKTYECHHFSEIQMVILDFKTLTIDMIPTTIPHSFTPKHSVARIFVSII